MNKQNSQFGRRSRYCFKLTKNTACYYKSIYVEFELYCRDGLIGQKIGKKIVFSNKWGVYGGLLSLSCLPKCILQRVSNRSLA